MKGNDYVKGNIRKAWQLLPRPWQHWQYNEFTKSEQFKNLFYHDSLLNELEDLYRELGTVKSNLYPAKEEKCDKDIFDDRTSKFIQSWEKSKISTSNLLNHFKEFQDSNEGNENFRYWNVFLREMYPALRDFELSVRKGDWYLFVSAVLEDVFPLYFSPLGELTTVNGPQSYTKMCWTCNESSQICIEILQMVVLSAIWQNGQQVESNSIRQWKIATISLPK